MAKKKKVSLVLSSGGARGLAHVGVIEELEKRNYENLGEQKKFKRIFRI